MEDIHVPVHMLWSNHLLNSKGLHLFPLFSYFGCHHLLTANTLKPFNIKNWWLEKNYKDELLGEFGYVKVLNFMPEHLQMVDQLGRISHALHYL